MGHLRVTVGHPRVTTGNFFSISKHKANTTELHPKVMSKANLYFISIKWKFK